MSGKAKKIAVSLLVLVIIGGVIGYLMWNKPHENVAGSDAVKVDAAELYQSFATDSAKAKTQYLQHVLEVGGIVGSVSKNQQNQQVLLIKTNTEGASVNCTFEGPLSNLPAGTVVQVKGICNGMGEGDADLGILGDVYLVRCYIVQK